MISDKLEQARISPEEDYHLKGDIRRALRAIESDRNHSGLIEEELGSLDPDHPVYRLIDSIRVWEGSDHEEFESGVRAALEALDDLYELALEEEWYSVASYALLKSIEYREGLGGFDATEQFDEVLNFFYDHFYGGSEVDLGQLGDHVEKMLEHLDEMEEDNISKLSRLVEDRAQQLRENRQYMAERDYLDYYITIKNHLGENVSEEESRLVESYEDELEQKSSANSMLKADILERGVSRCQSFLPDEKENEWRLRIRELNKQAREEMPATEHEVDLSEDITRIVDHFKQVQSKTSSWEALVNLLYQPIGQGNFEEALENIDEAPAANMLPKNVISSEGDSIGFEPGMNQDGERAPTGYIAGLRASNHTLAVALRRLIDQKLLSESDFYMVLTLLPGIAIQDEAFLTDTIINLFEERYAEAVHLAVPRLESVTANVYEEMGKAVTKNQGQLYRQKGLGGLFKLIEEDISTNFGKYLQYRYTDTAGQNIRNQVAHGQIKYSAANFKQASTLLFDIYRTAARIEENYN
ncbi:hypothetical protein [Halobellus rubicundus]|uniref:DUF4209 domain-containing protein n=1 Tax=Halobellus rubicundus TaxID=2996466 RepID=A0ABD5MBM9_9EURY